MSFIEELKQLAELRSQGILTEEEFAAQKAVLLQSSRGEVGATGGAASAPPAASPEKVYFERALRLGQTSVNVRVSSLAAELGDQVFATQNISSVAVADNREEVAKQKATLILMALLFWGFAWQIWGSDVDWWDIALVGFGLLCMLSAFALKLTYCVSIRGGGGESRALCSRERELVVEVVGAIDAAIRTRH